MSHADFRRYPSSLRFFRPQKLQPPMFFALVSTISYSLMTWFLWSVEDARSPAGPMNDYVQTEVRPQHQCGRGHHKGWCGRQRGAGIGFGHVSPTLGKPPGLNPGSLPPMPRGAGDPSASRQTGCNDAAASPPPTLDYRPPEPKVACPAVVPLPAGRRRESSTLSSRTSLRSALRSELRMAGRLSLSVSCESLSNPVVLANPRLNRLGLPSVVPLGGTKEGREMGGLSSAAARRRI